MTDPELEELKKITKILTLVYGETVEKELSKVITSDERKKIWVLMDGVRTVKEIAQLVEVTVRSVNRFILIASKTGLVEAPWGKPPRRMIDYVPPSWANLIKLQEEAKENGEK